MLNLQIIAFLQYCVIMAIIAVWYDIVFTNAKKQTLVCQKSTYPTICKDCSQAKKQTIRPRTKHHCTTCQNCSEYADGQ